MLFFQSYLKRKVKSPTGMKRFEVFCALIRQTIEANSINISQALKIIPSMDQLQIGN